MKLALLGLLSVPLLASCSDADVPEIPQLSVLTAVGEDGLYHVSWLSWSAEPMSERGLGGFRASALAAGPEAGSLFAAEDEELLVVDADTARCTRIGALGAASVIALANDAVAGVLYGLDATSNRLLRIDPTTGAGTAVGAAHAPPLLALALDPATGTLYASDGATLVVLDGASGAATSVGAIGFSRVDALTWTAGGELLGIDADTRALLMLDPATGAGTAVGPCEATLLAVDPGSQRLLGVDARRRLLEVDASSGAVEHLASLGFTELRAVTRDVETEAVYAVDVGTDVLLRVRYQGRGELVGPLGFQDVRALAFDAVADELLGADGATDALLEIDVETGAATSIGAIGIDGVDSLALEPESGRLFGVAAGGALVEIDRATGAGALVATLDAPVTELAIDGIAHMALGSDAEGIHYSVDLVTGACTALPLRGFPQHDLVWTGYEGSFHGIYAGTQLVHIDLASQRSFTLHSPGFTGIRGLAPGPDLALYGSDLATGLLVRFEGHGCSPVGPLGIAPVTDLAFDPRAGRMYGVADQRLLSVDLESGAASEIAPLAFSALGIAFDEASRKLYVTSLTDLYAVHPRTGTATHLAALEKPGFYTLAAPNFLDGLFALPEAGDALLVLDPTSGAMELRGETGYRLLGLGEVVLGLAR